MVSVSHTLRFVIDCIFKSRLYFYCKQKINYSYLGDDNCKMLFKKFQKQSPFEESLELYVTDRVIAVGKNYSFSEKNKWKKMYVFQ